MRDPITINLKGCARCNSGGHDDLTFQPFTIPVTFDGKVLFTHWALCPSCLEPIMMVITDP